MIIKNVLQETLSLASRDEYEVKGGNSFDQTDTEKTSQIVIDIILDVSGKNKIKSARLMKSWEKKMCKAKKSKKRPNLMRWLTCDKKMQDTDDISKNKKVIQNTKKPKKPLDKKKNEDTKSKKKPKFYKLWKMICFVRHPIANELEENETRAEHENRAQLINEEDRTSVQPNDEFVDSNTVQTVTSLSKLDKRPQFETAVLNNESIECDISQSVESSVHCHKDEILYGQESGMGFKLDGGQTSLKISCKNLYPNYELNPDVHVYDNDTTREKSFSFDSEFSTFCQQDNFADGVTYVKEIAETEDMLPNYIEVKECVNQDERDLFTFYNVKRRCEENENTITDQDRSSYSNQTPEDFSTSTCSTSDKKHKRHKEKCLRVPQKAIKMGEDFTAMIFNQTEGSISSKKFSNPIMPCYSTLSTPGTRTDKSDTLPKQENTEKAILPQIQDKTECRNKAQSTQKRPSEVTFFLFFICSN